MRISCFSTLWKTFVKHIFCLHTATADVWKVYLKLGKFSKKFREIDVALNLSLFLRYFGLPKKYFRRISAHGDLHYLNQNFISFHLNVVSTMAQVSVKSSSLISKVRLSHFWPFSKQTQKHWILKWNVKNWNFPLILT